MRETATNSQQTEVTRQGRVVHKPTSLTTSDERLARMWALTPAQRLEEGYGQHKPKKGNSPFRAPECPR